MHFFDILMRVKNNVFFFWFQVENCGQHISRRGAAFGIIRHLFSTEFYESSYEIKKNNRLYGSKLAFHNNELVYFLYRRDCRRDQVADKEAISLYTKMDCFRER